MARLHGIIHSHRKTEKAFLHLEMFDVLTTGYTAHIDTTFKILPHTRKCGCIDILYCCNSLYHTRMSWLYAGRVLRILCTKCTLHSNHRLTRVIFQHTKDFSPGAAIFSLHTLASPSGRKNKDEQVSGKKRWIIPSTCTGFVNTCPTVFL
jgi:hypothetical protein